MSLKTNIVNLFFIVKAIYGNKNQQLNKTKNNVFFLICIYQNGIISYLLTIL